MRLLVLLSAIAMPVVAWLSQRGVFGPVIRPGGDYAEDMRPAFEFFRTLIPRYPERAAFPYGF